MASDVEPAPLGREERPRKHIGRCYMPPDTTERRDRIFKEVCTFFRLRSEDILDDNRHRRPALARFVIYWLLHEHLRMDYCRIGRFMGRDRTSVMYGVFDSKSSPEIELIARHIIKTIQGGAA